MKRLALLLWQIFCITEVSPTNWSCFLSCTSLQVSQLLLVCVVFWLLFSSSSFNFLALHIDFISHPPWYGPHSANLQLCYQCLLDPEWFILLDQTSPTACLSYSQRQTYPYVVCAVSIHDSLAKVLCFYGFSEILISVVCCHQFWGPFVQHWESELLAQYSFVLSLSFFLSFQFIEYWEALRELEVSWLFLKGWSAKHYWQCPLKIGYMNFVSCSFYWSGISKPFKRHWTFQRRVDSLQPAHW